MGTVEASILTLVDDFTRECLGLVGGHAHRCARLTRELDRIAEVRSYPFMIVSDNGTELYFKRHPGMAAGTRCRTALHRTG